MLAVDEVEREYSVRREGGRREDGRTGGREDGRTGGRRTEGREDRKTGRRSAGLPRHLYRRRGWRRTRREFLKGMATAAAVGVLPFGPGRPARPCRRAGCDSAMPPSPGAGDDLRAIDEISAAGYPGIQLRSGAVAQFGADPAALRARARGAQAHLRRPLERQPEHRPVARGGDARGARGACALPPRRRRAPSPDHRRTARRPRGHARRLRAARRAAHRDRRRSAALA